MKIIASIIYLVLFGVTVAAHAGKDFTFPIYRYKTVLGTTNTWYASKSQLDKAPKWNNKDEPPLLVGRAISLAKAAVVSIGGSKHCIVTSVEFRPFGGPSSIWFYVIHFEEVSTVGSNATCVVLMDGAVLWPALYPEPKKKSIQDYLD